MAAASGRASADVSPRSYVLVEGGSRTLTRYDSAHLGSKDRRLRGVAVGMKFIGLLVALGNGAQLLSLKAAIYSDRSRRFN